MVFAAIRRVFFGVSGVIIMCTGCGGLVPCSLDRCVGDFSSLEGPYLGQRLPGMEPELFAPGFVSTGLDELNSVFHPNGEEFYFAVDIGPRFVLMMSRREEMGWTEPEVLDLSRRYSAVDLAFTADGSRMLFCSNRPRSGGIQPENDYDIWWVERRPDGLWGEPRPVGGGINTAVNEFYPSLTDDGTLYFLSRREESVGGNDIYRSRLVDGEYSVPENLGSVINTDGNEGDAFVARDESFLIFVSSGHARQPDEGRLFVSFRTTEGGWSEPRNLGPATNRSDFCPTLSPDGRFFFFTGTRTPWDSGDDEICFHSLVAGLPKPQNGNDDIYWVDAEFVTRLRPNSGNRVVL